MAEIIRKYESIPPDPSGRVAKNRFRNELLWGVSKAIDLLFEHKKFIVVFDNLTDIEIHYPNEAFEFYSVKTSITEHLDRGFILDKNGRKHSVIGDLVKLFVEHQFTRDDATYTLVSNKPLFLDRKKVTDDFGLFEFEAFDQRLKTMIVSTLNDDFKTDIVDLHNLSYLWVNINLEEPETHILGRLCSLFKFLYGDDVYGPQALYNHIYTDVNHLTSCEKGIRDYDEMISKVAMKSEKLLMILEGYRFSKNKSYDPLKEYIRASYSSDAMKQTDLFDSLDILFDLTIDATVQECLAKIQSELVEMRRKHTEISPQKLVAHCEEKIRCILPLDYTEPQVTILAIYQVLKFMGIK